MTTMLFTAGIIEDNMTLSKTHSTTVESADKRQKRYVDRSKSESKTCLIHGSGHSYNEYKVLGDFGDKYY